MDAKLRKTEKKGEEKTGKEIRNNVNPAIKYRQLILYGIHNVIWFKSSTRPPHFCVFTFCLNPEHHIPNTKDGSHHVFILSMQRALFCITLAELLATLTGLITLLYDRAVTPMYTTYNAT